MINALISKSRITGWITDTIFLGTFWDTKWATAGYFALAKELQFVIFQLGMSKCKQYLKKKNEEKLRIFTITFTCL